MSEIAAARPAPLHGHTAAHRRTPPHPRAAPALCVLPVLSLSSSLPPALSLRRRRPDAGGVRAADGARAPPPSRLAGEAAPPRHPKLCKPRPPPQSCCPAASLAVPTRPPIGRLLHPPAASRPPQAAAALALRRETQGLLRPAAGLSEPLVPLHEPSVRRIGGAGAGTAAESDPPVSLGRGAPRGAWRGCSQRALAVNRSGRRGRRCCGASRCSPPAPSEA